MDPELNDSSSSQPADNTPPVSLEETAPADASRAEMETSVLDALRPLLRPKRKKGTDEGGDTLSGAAAPAEPSEPLAETKGESEVDNTMFGSAPFAAGLFSPLPGTVETARAAADDEFEDFATIGEELERRSRQSATMVRLLEQHRQQLQMAEKERDDAYDKLARVVPVVQETAQALREAMDARKIDEDPARMHRLFMLNGRALDELEKVAVNLFADFLWCKSAWEQYARSVEDARKLRSQLDV